MPLAIRAASLDDATEITRLQLQLGYSPPLEHVTESLSRMFTRPGERFLIAELDGRPVGCVHAVLTNYVDVAPYVHIAGLVVDATVRRQGVGRRLMAEVEDWARQQGYGAVRLASSSTRTNAHRFYESIGYTNIKTQYSFAKEVGGEAGSLGRFVPRVD